MNLTNEKQIVHLPEIVTSNFKVDIFKAEKPGNLRKFTEADFLKRKSVPYWRIATRQGSDPRGALVGSRRKAKTR